METIRFLLKAALLLAMGLFLMAAILWVVGLLYPELKPSRIFNFSFLSGDWLPAPKQYGGLLTARNTNGMNGKVYQPGPAYDGYANLDGPDTGAQVEWVIYTATGTQVIRGKNSPQGTTISNPPAKNANGFSERSAYIRNLSVYDGGNIYYGQTIYGEAKSEMFRNGIFRVFIVDMTGRVLASMDAINTGTWSIPGWSRFQMTVPTRLPGGIPCGLAFFSATSPVRVGMNVTCK